MVLADHGQMCQVLLTLLGNARDAMPTGGQVTITTRCLPSEGHTNTDTPLMRLSVADTGVGIAAETLDRIFAPSFTTKQVGAGTGLGLTVAHALVEQCSGRIHAESVVGHGTTVHIDLPSRALVSVDTPSVRVPPGNWPTS